MTCYFCQNKVIYLGTTKLGLFVYKYSAKYLNWKKLMPWKCGITKRGFKEWLWKHFRDYFKRLIHFCVFSRRRSLSIWHKAGHHLALVGHRQLLPFTDVWLFFLTGQLLQLAQDLYVAAMALLSPGHAVHHRADLLFEEVAFAVLRPFSSASWL